MMRFLIVATALVSIGLAALPTCPGYDACKVPTTDICQKMNTYLCPATIIKPAECVKLLGMVATEICGGSNITDLTNKFMGMATKCLSLGGMATAMGGANNYKGEVEKPNCSSTFGAQMTIIGGQFKIILEPMVTAAAKVLAPYKGKCTSADVYPAFAKYACPQATAQLIQKLITALKGAQGPKCWPNAPKCLSPKVLLLSKYTC